MTDLKRWEKTAKVVPTWDERNLKVCDIIKSMGIKRIYDFGAGNQTIRKYLGKGYDYFPLDCVLGTPDVFLIDFNREFRLPPFSKDAKLFVFSGFLEYVKNVDAFLDGLSRAAAGTQTVFTYAVKPKDLNRRAALGWLNNLGEEEAALEYFRKKFSKLDKLDSWNGQLIMTGVLR